MIRKGPSMRRGVEQRLKAILAWLRFCLVLVMMRGSLAGESVDRWGRKLVSGSFQRSSSTNFWDFSSSTRMRKGSFFSKWLWAVSTMQRSFVAASRTWKKTTRVSEDIGWRLGFGNDHTARDEKFNSVLIGHIDVIDVFFGNQEEKTRDWVGRSRRKDGDKRSFDFSLTLFSYLSRLKTDCEMGSFGKWEHHRFFKRLFSICGKEGREHVFAHFVDRFD